MWTREVRVDCDVCDRFERYDEPDMEGPSIDADGFTTIFVDEDIHNLHMSDNCIDICDDCTDVELDSENIVIGRSENSGRAFALTHVRDNDVRNYARNDVPSRFRGLCALVDAVYLDEEVQYDERFSLRIDDCTVAQAEDGWVNPDEIPLDISGRIEYEQGWPSSDGKT